MVSSGSDVGSAYTKGLNRNRLENTSQRDQGGLPRWPWVSQVTWPTQGRLRVPMIRAQCPQDVETVPVVLDAQGRIRSAPRAAPGCSGGDKRTLSALHLGNILSFSRPLFLRPKHLQLQVIDSLAGLRVANKAEKPRRMSLKITKPLSGGGIRVNNRNPGPGSECREAPSILGSLQSISPRNGESAILQPPTVGQRGKRHAHFWRRLGRLGCPVPGASGMGQSGTQSQLSRGKSGTFYGSQKAE